MQNLILASRFCALFAPICLLLCFIVRTYIDKGTSQLFVVGSIHNTPNIFHFIKPTIVTACQLHVGNGTDCFKFAPQLHAQCDGAPVMTSLLLRHLNCIILSVYSEEERMPQ